MKRLTRFICGALLGATLTLGALAIIPESVFAKDYIQICYNDFGVPEWCCLWEYEDGEWNVLDCWTEDSYP